jgi:hypothetical protein
MPVETFARWVQSTSFSMTLAGSTWGYPAIGALHVLGIAVFGGVVFARAAPVWKILGPIWMLCSGLLLFCIEPVRCAASQSFRIKMVLLVALAANGLNRSRWANAVSVALLVGVIFAARGIAYF